MPNCIIKHLQITLVIWIKKEYNLNYHPGRKQDILEVCLVSV